MKYCKKWLGTKIPSHLKAIMKLFPLNGADGLGSEVIKNAVDSFNFMGDSVGNFVKNCVRNFFNGCGHCVFGVDCADDCGPAFITAFVFYANALDVRNNDEILPNFFCKAVVCKFFAENCVCFTKGGKAVTGDCAKAANTKAGTRERLAVNHSVRKTKSFADYAYFVFEEKFDRFNKFKIEVFGKAADVVVALDCFFAFCGFDGFKNVGIDGSLCEEFNAFEFACFVSENFDEFFADDLSLSFGFGNAGKKIEEAVGCVNIDKVCVKLVSENFDYVFGFVFAHKAVVYVNANELFADCFDKKSCNNGRIDTAGKSEKDFFVANLFLDFGNLFFNEFFGKFGGGDTFHSFGTNAGHRNSSYISMDFRHT